MIIKEDLTNNMSICDRDRYITERTKDNIEYLKNKFSAYTEDEFNAYLLNLQL